MLEQSTIFQQGMGFARKALRSHKYLEKARKNPIAPKFLFSCREHWFGHRCAGLDRHEALSASPRHCCGLSSEHRFCSAGTGLPWHQNTAAQMPGPALQMAQPSHAQGNTLGSFGCLGAILTPPPQGHYLLPRHPHRLSQRTNFPQER